MIMKLILTLFVLGWTLFAGCAIETVADADTAARQAIAQAQAEYDASVEVGHAWVATQRHLTLAKNSLAAGDMAQALASARRASQLAQASLDQARIEAEAWKTRFPS